MNKESNVNKENNVASNNGPINHSTTYPIPVHHNKMCYYRRYIFSTCGHSIWGHVVALCPSKSSANTTPAAQTFSSPTAQTCPDHKSHPFQTIKIDSLCAPCAKERERLMSSLQLDSPLIDTGSWNWKPEGEKTPTAHAVAVMRQVMKEAKLLERGRIEG